MGLRGDGEVKGIRGYRPAGERGGTWGTIPNVLSVGRSVALTRSGPRGPALGGRSQEGLSWAGRSVGPGLAVEAGASLPAWRRRGSSLGMPRRGGRGGASLTPPPRAGSQWARRRRVTEGAEVLVPRRRRRRRTAQPEQEGLGGEKGGAGGSERGTSGPRRRRGLGRRWSTGGPAAARCRSPSSRSPGRSWSWCRWTRR